jgi:hypothetical protein
MLSKSGDSKALSLNCIILVFKLSTIVFFRVPFITYLRVTNHRRDISTSFKTDTLTFRSGKKKREVIKHQLVYSTKEMKKIPTQISLSCLKIIFYFRLISNFFDSTISFSFRHSATNSGRTKLIAELASTAECQSYKTLFFVSGSLDQ